MSIRKDKVLDATIHGDEDHHDHQVAENISAGRFINGVYLTREQIDKIVEEKKKEYFDLLDLEKQLNNYAVGKLK